MNRQAQLTLVPPTPCYEHIEPGIDDLEIYVYRKNILKPSQRAELLFRCGSLKLAAQVTKPISTVSDPAFVFYVMDERPTRSTESPIALVFHIGDLQ